MKKTVQIIRCIIPVFAAYAIELTISVVLYAVYGIVKGIQQASEGGINGENIPNTITDNSLSSEYSLAIYIISVIVCIIIFGRWYKRMRMEEQVRAKGHALAHVFTKKNIVLMIMLGVALQIGISILLSVILSLNTNWAEDYNNIINQLGGGNTWLSVLYIVLIAPIGEELIFRGVVFTYARRSLPFLSANILQSFLFAVYHGNVYQGVYAFFIGLFFGLLCNVLKSIYGSIFLHMTVNLTGILLEFIFVEDVFQNWAALGILGVLSIGVIFGSTSLIIGSNNQLEELELLNDTDGN